MSELMLIPHRNAPDLQSILSNTHADIGLPGRALAAARRLTGLRQTEMAEQGGFSVSMLKLLERDGTEHFAPYCKSLASYIDVLDKHGVRLLLGNDEVTLKQRFT